MSHRQFSFFRGEFHLSNFEDGVLSSAFMVGLLLASPLFASLAKLWVFSITLVIICFIFKWEQGIYCPVLAFRQLCISLLRVKCMALAICIWSSQFEYRFIMAIILMWSCILALKLSMMAYNKFIQCFWTCIFHLFFSRWVPTILIRLVCLIWIAFETTMTYYT